MTEAREYVPFGAGNAAAVRHGASTPRVYEPVAEALAAALVERHPEVAGFSFAVAAWARAEARAMILDRHAARAGLLDGDGNPQAFTTLMMRVEKAAADARATLGLDPRSQAVLAKDRAGAVVGADLAAVIEAGQRVLAGLDGPEAGCPEPLAAPTDTGAGEAAPVVAGPSTGGVDLAGEALAAHRGEYRAEWAAEWERINGRAPDPAVVAARFADQPGGER